jgi:hypothetical protein
MKYPYPIEANLHELSGNFYKKNQLVVKSPYSLHTEPSFEPKIFNSKIVNELENIKMSQIDNIPQLWKNKKWAKDFFIFIERLIDSNDPPEVLEIHPPYNDYCKSFDRFLDIFKVFYKKIKKKYPTTTIVIENRFGTRYKYGKFLLSTCDDVLNFCKVLKKTENSDIELKIVLDYPQLFSAEINANGLKWDDIKMKKEDIILFNKKIKKYKSLIGGFHIWGKQKSKDGKDWKSHAGNLNTFFSNNKTYKREFLSSVFSTFNDNTPRYFVPEVISGKNDLHSIVKDMKRAGFIFISNYNRETGE